MSFAILPPPMGEVKKRDIAPLLGICVLSQKDLGLHTIPSLTVGCWRGI